MKSSWGNVRVVYDRCGCHVIGSPRKKYTRTHPRPQSIRIAPLQREKSAIIKLRKQGYPTNMISKALGRSTSYIHRVLVTAVQRLTIRKIDMRKLPAKTRLRCAAIRWNCLQKFMPMWEKWICGEGDKPP